MTKELELKELQEENRQLKNDYEMIHNCFLIEEKENKNLNKRFEKEKEIIKNLLTCCRNYPQENVEKIQQAEQFLRETDINNAVQKTNEGLNLDKITEEIKQREQKKMNREKLEKEAGDYAEKHAFRVPYDGSNRFYDDVDFKASKEGYIAGAKPREKQISKLKNALEKLEDERIQFIARLAFTENALNNYKAKTEKAVDLIAKLSQLKHHTDDCFTYDEYLKLIKEAEEFLKEEIK